MNLDERIATILAKWPAGMTAQMISNCYLNMEQDEFDAFMLEYSKGGHKYEDNADQCDGCMGVRIGRDDIKQLIRDVVAEITPEREGGSDLDNPQEVGWDMCIDQIESNLKKILGNERVGEYLLCSMCGALEQDHPSGHMFTSKKPKGFRPFRS